ncbi:EAL domain-containing protein [uncultured Shewanella sp.]|uniref:EAL domain-containing protein n=1 Tax=uncultured Shewanella sp. TaxID=173975 RepID=UPI00262062BA|nr:EAL domain-containing protein [uncultured Shewanella sp.]
MLSQFLNQRHVSWLIFALFMLCGVSSYILTQCDIYIRLEARVAEFDNYYQKNLEAANRSLMAVNKRLQKVEANSCSIEVVDTLKEYILTSEGQAIVWVQFNDKELICSALGASPLPRPQYYRVIDSLENGMHIYQMEAGRNLNAKKLIYVGRYTDQYRWFIGIDVLPNIQNVLEHCLVCGGISIQLDDNNELFRVNQHDLNWGTLEFTSERTGLKYRFFVSYYAKALLWSTYFLATVVLFSVFISGWYFLRGIVTQYYWHRLFVAALSRREFYLAYQPIFDTDKLTIFGVEVLLRWSKPDGTTRNTGEFIGILENDPIMSEVTRWVVKTALSELKEQLDGKLIGWCSINVSAAEIEQGQMLPFLQELVQEGYPVEYLSFELTERMPMNNWQQLEDFIQACQALGCKVKLDDVGTGYSGSLCLQNLDFDYLKIDQQFVGHLGTPESKLSLIESYIAIAKELNISVIAEGVETLAQADILKVLGVNLQQGWLYSKALPVRELESYLLKAV